MPSSFHLDIDDCASNPCQNNGTCVDGVTSYTCKCLAGFTGAECQTSLYHLQHVYSAFFGLRYMHLLILFLVGETILPIEKCGLIPSHWQLFHKPMVGFEPWIWKERMGVLKHICTQMSFSAITYYQKVVLRRCWRTMTKHINYK